MFPILAKFDQLSVGNQSGGRFRLQLVQIIADSKNESGAKWLGSVGLGQLTKIGRVYVSGVSQSGACTSTSQESGVDQSQECVWQALAAVSLVMNIHALMFQEFPGTLP